MLKLFDYLTRGRVSWTRHHRQSFQDEEDHHTFSLDWATEVPTESDQRLFFLVPGILADAGCKYLAPFIKEISALGPTCIINYPLLVDPATGETIPDYSDPRYLLTALEYTALTYPHCAITLVGFSLGGTLAIKAQEHAARVFTICSPIRGADAWESIKDLYYRVMQSAFLLGPMRKLVWKNPSRWLGSLSNMLKASNSRSLTSAIEEDTGYVIYHMSIESLMKTLPLHKVTMLHTRDDSVIPYIPDSDPLFARVQRLTFDSGDHVMFTPQQVTEIVSLL